MGILSTLIWVTVTWNIHLKNNTSSTVYLKSMNFTLCKLYRNKIKKYTGKISQFCLLVMAAQLIQNKLPIRGKKKISRLNTKTMFLGVSIRYNNNNKKVRNH